MARLASSSATPHLYKRRGGRKRDGAPHLYQKKGGVALYLHRREGVGRVDWPWSPTCIKRRGVALVGMPRVCHYACGIGTLRVPGSIAGLGLGVA